MGGGGGLGLVGGGGGGGEGGGLSRVASGWGTDLVKRPVFVRPISPSMPAIG